MCAPMLVFETRPCYHSRTDAFATTVAILCAGSFVTGLCTEVVAQDLCCRQTTIDAKLMSTTSAASNFV